MNFPTYVWSIRLQESDLSEDKKFYIIEASDHRMNTYPALLGLDLPDGKKVLSTMCRVVKTPSGDVAAIVYDVDGVELLHVIND